MSVESNGIVLVGHLEKTFAFGGGKPTEWNRNTVSVGLCASIERQRRKGIAMKFRMPPRWMPARCSAGAGHVCLMTDCTPDVHESFASFGQHSSTGWDAAVEEAIHDRYDSTGNIYRD